MVQLSITAPATPCIDLRHLYGQWQATGIYTIYSRASAEAQPKKTGLTVGDAATCFTFSRDNRYYITGGNLFHLYMHDAGRFEVLQNGTVMRLPLHGGEINGSKEDFQVMKFSAQEMQLCWISDTAEDGSYAHLYFEFIRTHF